MLLEICCHKWSVYTETLKFDDWTLTVMIQINKFRQKYCRCFLSVKSSNVQQDDKTKTIYFRQFLALLCVCQSKSYEIQPSEATTSLEMKCAIQFECHPLWTTAQTKVSSTNALDTMRPNLLFVCSMRRAKKKQRISLSKHWWSITNYICYGN